MATRKTSEEQLAEIQKKMAQLKAKEKMIKARHSQKERNARTRRFCVLGGEIEKLLDRKLTDDDVNNIIAFLTNQEQRGKFFSKALEPKEKDTK